MLGPSTSRVCLLEGVLGGGFVEKGMREFVGNGRCGRGTLSGRGFYSRCPLCDCTNLAGCGRILGGEKMLRRLCLMCLTRRVFVLYYVIGWRALLRVLICLVFFYNAGMNGTKVWRVFRLILGIPVGS